jgi:hypothetical protein
MQSPIVPEKNPDPKPVGSSLFIPFEGFNPRTNKDGQGEADFRIALDIPPQTDIHSAKVFMMNDPICQNRIIEFREYSEKEVKSDALIQAYIAQHRSTGRFRLGILARSRKAP